jgi:adenylate kinase
VLLGAPGSGKGTQAARLAAWGDVPNISTGEMLRQAVGEGSELGRRVRDIMAAGELVDDATMADVVRERLAAPDAAQGFVLDGFPRTLAQVTELDSILEAAGRGLDAVVAIEVPEAVLTQRMLDRKRQDGRDDDKREVIEERLRVYRSKTEPLAEHYRRRGLLRVVDGDREMDAVTESILRALAVEA